MTSLPEPCKLGGCRSSKLQEQPELGHRNGNSSFAGLLVCVKEALAEQEAAANPDGILPYVPYVRVT